jgi:hypothetical protein
MNAVMMRRRGPTCTPVTMSRPPVRNSQCPVPRSLFVDCCLWSCGPVSDTSVFAGVFLPLLIFAIGPMACYLLHRWRQGTNSGLGDDPESGGSSSAAAAAGGAVGGPSGAANVFGAATEPPNALARGPSASSQAAVAGSAVSSAVLMPSDSATATVPSATGLRLRLWLMLWVTVIVMSFLTFILSLGVAATAFQCKDTDGRVQFSGDDADLVGYKVTRGRLPISPSPLPR